MCSLESLGSNNSHHQIIVLVQCLITKVEQERESGFLVNVGHLGPMLMAKSIVERLEESANLVLIGFSPTEFYDYLAEIEGWVCCRFFICKIVVFGNIPWKSLSEKIPL